MPCGLEIIIMPLTLFFQTFAIKPLNVGRKFMTCTKLETSCDTG